MKIALAGTGQMGQAVAALAPEREHDIVARFDSAQPLMAAAPEDLNGAAVVIDFSLPGVVLRHIERYCEWQQPAVIGTTGWYDEMDRVEHWVEAHEGTLLYAPNFSLGVALVRQAVEHLTPLLDELPDFDAYVHEMHHTQKVDSPSGTARMLANVLIDGLERKTHLEPEAQHDRIDPKALHVSSTRAGSVFGEHTVGLDSPYDHVTLRHRAKNRKGFAFGALRAAEWLPGRTGLFTLDDLLADWLS